MGAHLSPRARPRRRPDVMRARVGGGRAMAESGGRVAGVGERLERSARITAASAS